MTFFEDISEKNNADRTALGCGRDNELRKHNAAPSFANLVINSKSVIKLSFPKRFTFGFPCQRNHKSK